MAGLPDARLSVRDGGLGVLATVGTGRHAKVGVASSGPIGELVRITDRDQAVATFGAGPLVSALVESLSAGAPLIEVVRTPTGSSGQIGTVAAQKEGGGSLSVTGSPWDEFDVVVEIVRDGGFNSAAFRYSTDGGASFSGTITVPSDGEYELPGTGMTLKFTQGDEPPESFLQGDVFRFRTTAPTATVEDIHAAVDVILHQGGLNEVIHVTGESDSSLWASLEARAGEAERNFQYLHFVAEARGPAAGETIDQWVNALVAERDGFAGVRTSVVAGRVRTSHPHARRQPVRNMAGLYLGHLMSLPVMRSPGRVRSGPLPGASALLPEGINDGHILALDEAGYITARQYRGLSGIYVTNGRMMAEETSDFRYVERRRVMDKACRQVRIAALGFIQDETDGSDEALDALEAHLLVPLTEMAKANPREIVAGRVHIPRDQNILSSETLRVRIGIIPLGTLRWIDIELGFENPFLASE